MKAAINSTLFPKDYKNPPQTDIIFSNLQLSIQCPFRSQDYTKNPGLPSIPAHRPTSPRFLAIHSTFTHRHNMEVKDEILPILYFIRLISFVFYHYHARLASDFLKLQLSNTKYSFTKLYNVGNAEIVASQNYISQGILKLWVPAGWYRFGRSPCRTQGAGETQRAVRFTKRLGKQHPRLQ